MFGNPHPPTYTTQVTNISGQLGFQCTEQNQRFLHRNSNKSREQKYSETLNDTIKSIVLEKHDFESRDDFITEISLAFSDCRDSNAGTELLMNQCSSKSRGFAIATLAEGFKPVVMEKHDFEYREYPIFIIILVFWDY